MKNVALWVGRPYQRDRLFDENGPLNRDDCLAAFRLLKARIEEASGICHTSDVFRKKGLTPDVVLFLDIPSRPVRNLLGNWSGKARPWVMLQECEVVSARNWNVSLHGQFERIFTWNGDFVDNMRYFKFNYSNSFPAAMPEVPSKKGKLCVLIAANKKSSHPLELYSKREETIRWFEKNHPEDFDLYGLGWDEYFFDGPRPIRLLNRIKPLTKLLAADFPSYRGPVERKAPVLSRYYFSICYENAREIPGYITEKIFDCFLAGCVPVYWGAPDIAEHMPAECFVDRREFDTHEALYELLKSMSETEYMRRSEAIKSFVSGKRAYPFSDRCFAEIVFNAIADE